MFVRQTPFRCQNFSIQSSETVDHPAFLAEVFSAEIAALLLSFSLMTLIGRRKDTKNFFVHLGKETVVQFFLNEMQFASLCSRGENISPSPSLVMSDGTHPNTTDRRRRKEPLQIN